MSKVRLIFSEAWSSISANISTTFAATITVLISMFLLGLFLALGTWVLSYSNHVKRELVVKVYFATGTHQPTQAQEAQVGQRLQHDPRVKTATFISKETAIVLLPAAYAFLAVTPSVRVRLKEIAIFFGCFAAVALPYPISLAVAGGSTSGKHFLTWQLDRKSTRLNSSHHTTSRMPSSA